MGFEDSAKQKTKGLINVQVCVETMRPFCRRGSRYTTNTDFACLISTLLNVVLKLEIALEKNIVLLHSSALGE